MISIVYRASEAPRRPSCAIELPSRPDLGGTGAGEFAAAAAAAWRLVSGAQSLRFKRTNMMRDHHQCANRQVEVLYTMKRVKFRFGKGFRVGIGNKASQCAEMVLAPGETQGGKTNHHKGADQWLYVLSGRGTAIVDGKRTPLLPGVMLLIEKRQNHEIRNRGKTPLRTLNIYVPPAYKKNGDPLPPGKP